MSDEEAERLMSGSQKIPLETSQTTSGLVEDEQPGMPNGEASSTSSQSVPVPPNAAAFGDTLNALKQNPEMLR